MYTLAKSAGGFLLGLGLTFVSRFGGWDLFSVTGVLPTCLEKIKMRKNKREETRKKE